MLLNLLKYLKIKLNIVTFTTIILIVILNSGCNKHSGFEKVNDGETVSSDLLDCLGKGMISEVIINELTELEDSTIFSSIQDSSVVDFCYDQYNFVNVDFSSRTLIGIGYQYLLDNSANNGTSSVKIYKNNDGSAYIVDVFIEGADKSGLASGVDQIWFSIPKVNENATFEFNKKNI